MNRWHRVFQAGILLAFLFALVAGLAGVDYGTQWDQNMTKGFLYKYVRTGNILPGEYIYPPGITYLAATALIPYSVPSLLRYGADWTPTQEYLMRVMLYPNHAFLLNLRRVIVFFTMLTILWAGLAAGQRNWMAGFVAAGLLAFSWEINYQSRIVHPDGPTMQFAALTILFSVLALYRRRPFSASTWLHLAAVASAAATATKYTAGVSLGVVLILAFAVWQQDKEKLANLLGRFFTLLLTFTVVFLLLVPGAILEFPIFFQQVLRAQQVYAGGHGLHTMEPGWDYLSREIVYLGAVAFSIKPVLAILVSLSAVLGAGTLLRSGDRSERWLALALVGVPLSYVLFLATHKVLFVRNLLQTLPSIAILAGIGFSWVFDKLSNQKRYLKALPAVALLAILVVNGYWIVYSAWTIRMRHTDLFAVQAISEISKRPEELVYITPAAQALLSGQELPANVTTEHSQEANLVLSAYLGDSFDEEEGHWPINWPNAAPEIFGPNEINMDWYASWPGVERFVLSVPELAKEDGRPYRATPAQPVLLPAASDEGILVLDGQQFYLEKEDGSTLFILNSANPRVVMALREVIDEPVHLKGVPLSEKRPMDWFITELNDVQIMEDNELRMEYNFSRFYYQLSPQQRQCLSDAIDGVYLRELHEHTFGFAELSDLELISAADCIN